MTDHTCHGARFAGAPAAVAARECAACSPEEALAAPLELPTSWPIPNGHELMTPGELLDELSDALREPVATITAVGYDLSVYLHADNESYLVAEPARYGQLRVHLFTNAGFPAANYARALLWTSRAAAQALADEQA